MVLTLKFDLKKKKALGPSMTDKKLNSLFYWKFPFFQQLSPNVLILILAHPRVGSSA